MNDTHDSWWLSEHAGIQAPPVLLHQQQSHIKINSQCRNVMTIIRLWRSFIEMFWLLFLISASTWKIESYSKSQSDPTCGMEHFVSNFDAWWLEGSQAGDLCCIAMDHCNHAHSAKYTPPQLWAHTHTHTLCQYIPGEHAEAKWKWLRDTANKPPL